VKKSLRQLLAFILIILMALGSVPVVRADNSDDSASNVVDSLGGLRFAPDRVLVRLADTGTMQAFSTFSSSPVLPDLGVDYTESRLLNPADDSLFGGFSIDSITENKKNVYVLTLAETGRNAVENALAILNANPAVDIAEPDFLYELIKTPNDPLFNVQYALQSINAQQAWEITTGSKNIVVGIIDTGIDGTHPDLIPNLWVNPNPGSMHYINDIHGYNFTGRGNNWIPVGGIPTDYSGHGTHVAGIVGAKGNNGIGVTGINWDVSLAWLGANGDESSIQLSAVIEAINYANSHKIPILNGSWGGPDYSLLLHDTIKAYKGLFVAAAGNNDNDNDVLPTYPASFDLLNVISVASTDSSDQRSSFSNFGVKSVHIAAPGTAIRSTYLFSAYQNMNGTSMASPYVAGVAALMLAVNPDLSPERIKEILLSTARHPNGLASYGFGILDAGAAVQYVAQAWSTPASIIDFANERLTGLAANAAYTINEVSMTANASGHISIDAAWMGTTVSIIKMASDSKLASTAQNLPIPARPATAPGVSPIQPTAVGGTGGISGTTAEMEYRAGSTGAWILCSTPNTTGLQPGTYQVRFKATATGFAGAAYTPVTIVNVTTTSELIILLVSGTIMNNPASVNAAVGIIRELDTDDVAAANTDPTVLNALNELEEAHKEHNNISLYTYVNADIINILGFNSYDITIIGACNNATGGTVAFRLARPQRTIIVSPAYTNATIVSMTLDGYGINSNDLSVPVTITMPIPAGIINPDDFRILHFHEGDSASDYDLIIPQLNNTDVHKTATFTLTRFSEFAFVELASEITDPTDPTDSADPDPTDPTDPDPTDSTDPDPTDPTNPDPTDPTNPADPPIEPPIYPIDKPWHPPLPTNPFNDVPNAPNWQNNAVSWAYRNNITTGSSATTFSPGNNVTRGQLVTFLYRIAGEPEVSGSHNFGDVTAGQFYSIPVLWAVRNRITTGTSPTTFAPYAPITREQLATMFMVDNHIAYDIIAIRTVQL
jgi:subtilisin family serine protease